MILQLSSVLASLITYSAPGKGATPLGKLCVSAVRMGCNVRSWVLTAHGLPGSDGNATRQLGPRIDEELSWKAMMLLLLGPCSREEKKVNEKKYMARQMGRHARDLPYC